MAKIPLYRPYFSGTEISLLAKWSEEAASSSESTPEIMALYKKLRLTVYKIGNEIIKPVMTRDETLEEKIGLVKPNKSHPESELIERLNNLAMRYMEDHEALTAEELEEGKRLELIQYKQDMGMFS